MEEEPRRLRADAERNRQRLIEAATEMFGERGMEVGVGEIAQRAGVGRGTLFRHFATKDALIAAVVVVALEQSIERAREAATAADPTESLFALIDQTLDTMQTNRALYEALDDAWMANPAIQSAHCGMTDAVQTLLGRAQQAGTVRPDIGAVDLILMIKGVGESSCAFQHVDDTIAMRQIDLVKSAITADGIPAPALRGEAPTIEDLERHKQAICGPQGLAAAHELGTPAVMPAHG